MSAAAIKIEMRPLAYRVPDACKMLGIGRSTLFEMIKDGRLEARCIGLRLNGEWFTFSDEIKGWLAEVSR